MDFLRVPREAWSGFFDDVSALMRRKLVEVEVVGIDAGDRIEAEWLPLTGLTYDEHDDELYVQATTPSGPLDHAIQHPKEISSSSARPE